MEKENLKKSFETEKLRNKWAEANERPSRLVFIRKQFYIGKYEVTQEQFVQVMGYNPMRLKNAKFPVDSITWEEANKFNLKLSGLLKKKARFPSEAEWEYACRAGTISSMFFGDDEKEIGDFCWYRENSNKKTHAVGQKKPNNWGFYDMLGNGAEMVEDDWHENFIDAPANEQPWIGQPRSEFRVLRGGWSIAGPPDNRCASRQRIFFRGFGAVLGFRVVIDF